jgi:hypothetical protein
VAPTRDRELHWIPDEMARARLPRSRAIGAAVLAVSCVVIGIVIGRLTTGTPATGSRPPEVVGVASAKRPAEPGIVRPSLALKGDANPKPAGSAGMQAEPTTNPPKVILLNPGTAGKKPSAAPDEARARVPPARERAFREPPENRGRQATEGRRDMLSPPARDYQSLRDYTLSR